MDRIYNHIVVRMPRWRMDVLLDGGETYQRDHAAIQMWAAEHIEILDEHDLAGVARIAATQFPRIVRVQITDAESGCGYELLPAGTT